MNEVMFENPTDDFLRQWAINPSNFSQPYQDWELLITTHERGPLFVEIVNSEAEGRLFFLDCLYHLTYKSIDSEKQVKQLGYLFQKVNQWSSKSELVLWKERSIELIERSNSPSFSLKDDVIYELWKNGESE